MKTESAIAIAALAIVCLFIPSAASAAKDKTIWLCKPGLADNPCKTNLDTAQVAPDGSVLGTTGVKSKKPKVDCFYVYPTVSDDEGTNADLEEDPEERSIALYQAARYAQHCKIYAPLYRQITLEALFSGEPISDEQRDLGYNDVVAAWRTYLRKYNDGRGVILIGHSQGTYVLRQLIREEIDKRRSVRERLVSAILLGGNVTVGEGGGGPGGDFKNIKPCRKDGKFGCVVGFSTFNAPVPADARFGRPGSAVFLPSDPAKTDVLCANPAALGGGSAPLDLLLPTEPFAPGTTIGLGTSRRRRADPRSVHRGRLVRDGGLLLGPAATTATTPTSCRRLHSAERPPSTRLPTPPGACT